MIIYSDNSTLSETATIEVTRRSLRSTKENGIGKPYAPVRPSVCHLVSATKPIIAFFGNSVLEGFRKTPLGTVSLGSIGSLISILCLETQ
jgi:hypothetical protein